MAGSSFIAFGDLRIDPSSIHSYRIIKGTKVIVHPRAVNIDPNSYEGKRLLNDFNKNAIGRAVGAGVLHGTAGAVGGAAAGVAAAIVATGPIGWATFGVITVGSVVRGVIKSKKKSEDRKRDLYKKDKKVAEDDSVLEVLLKNGTVHSNISGFGPISTQNYAASAISINRKSDFKHECLRFSVNTCGFDIYKKCEELDAIFGVQSPE